MNHLDVQTFSANCTIRSEDIQALQSRVDALVERGWKPHGFIFFDCTDGVAKFAQTMVKP